MLHYNYIIKINKVVSFYLQRFKFLGWNVDYIERINRIMSKYIEYLK